MQKMTATALQGFRSEFKLTCAAQDGNGKAWTALWYQYKGMMMSRLIAVKGLTFEELESEAIEVFANTLTEFNRNKVSSENSYSMFLHLLYRVERRRDKLIKQRKKEVHLYFEHTNCANPSWNNADNSYRNGRTLHICSDDTGDNIQDMMLGLDPHIYNVYNPEKLVIESLHEDDSVRVKNLYSKFSPFQRDILEARREGMTLAQVARKFCCSVNTIKYHIQKAKRYANDIFEVCYA